MLKQIISGEIGQPSHARWNIEAGARLWWWNKLGIWKGQATKHKQ